MLFLFIFFGIVVVVAVGFAANRYTKLVAAAWTDAASALGLEYHRQGYGKPKLEGAIRGMRVKVDVRVQKSGKSQQTYTRYRVWVPSRGFNFKLTRQTGISRITKFFGAQDVELGDVAFDDAFVVKTDNETALRQFLDGRMMGVLLRTSAAYPGIVFEDHLVAYERSGLETKRDAIVSAVARLVDAAAALSGARSGNAAREIVAARERGELADLAAKMRNATRKKEQSLDERLLELDTLATAGDREAAGERLRDLETTLPADPEVSGWRDRLKTPPAPVAGDQGPVDPEELATELFSGSALSFESEQVFDERYRGRRVHWSARVKSVDRIRTGSDLGPEGGDKLVATIASIDHDLYGNTEIDAVVGLASGAASRLNRGDEVTFSGRLIQVDALVRNVFVAGGKLG